MPPLALSEAAQIRALRGADVFTSQPSPDDQKAMHFPAVGAPGSTR
jgi:hypothetical protein